MFRPRRSGFTLIEVLLVLGILLFVVSLGVGVSIKAFSWSQDTAAERLVGKLSERLQRRYDNLVKEAHDWTPSPSAPNSILRLAGGSARRAEVLKIKLLYKWNFPANYLEVQNGIAESIAYGYSPSGYPSLVALRSRLQSRGWNPLTPLPEQNAAVLLALFDTTFGSSVDDLAPNEIGSTSIPTDVNPTVIDSWGQPVQFVRYGAFVANPLSNSATQRDPDDPDGTLQDVNSVPSWYANNASWFMNTFGYDPAQPFAGALLVWSGGADKNLTTWDDNLDSYRLQTRVGRGQ